jgi:hypothetical protein
MIKPIKDFVQGDSFKVKIRHNPIINITGAVLTLTLAKSEAVDPVLNKSITVALSTDSANGIAYIPVTSQESVNIPPGQYYVTIKRVLDGETITLIRTGLANVGKITCFKDLK